jgi:hypothetical protein
MAELGRLERATTPLGPPESDEPVRVGPGATAETPGRAAGATPVADKPASSPSKSGDSARITGTLSVSPFARSSAHAAKSARGGISVALDPALMAETQPADAPKPGPAAVPEHAPTGATEPQAGAHGAASGKGQSRGTTGNVTAPVAARPTPHATEDSHRDTSQAARTTGRISGTFNDVERDFFAREADLYKRETEDNFADLDEPASRGTAKRPPGRGQSKRRP